MHSPDAIYQVRQEQHKDYLQALTHHQMLKDAGLDQSIYRIWRKKTAGWIGNKMVRWGAKLENYSVASSSKTITLNT